MENFMMQNYTKLYLEPLLSLLVNVKFLTLFSIIKNGFKIKNSFLLKFIKTIKISFKCLFVVKK